MVSDLEFSVFLMVILTTAAAVMISLFKLNYPKKKESTSSLFPKSERALFFLSGFFLFSLLNLISLVGYSYPVTTTLAFNFAFALTLWFISVILSILKFFFVSSFLPMNSPWYLVPFLGLVEMVSIMVRPVTLCFRLLANMSAGHILLSLICELPYLSWLFSGILFSLLELMVSMIQAFVFFMLVGVYFEESSNH